MFTSPNDMAYEVFIVSTVVVALSPELLTDLTEAWQCQTRAAKAVQIAFCSFCNHFFETTTPLCGIVQTRLNKAELTLDWTDKRILAMFGLITHFWWYRSTHKYSNGLLQLPCSVHRASKQVHRPTHSLNSNGDTAVGGHLRLHASDLTSGELVHAGIVGVAGE